MNKIFFRILILPGLIFCFTPVGFSEGATNQFSLSLLASTIPEAKAILNYQIKQPFLQGEGPLFSDNSIVYNISGEISPVSVNTGFEAILTPIAILELSLGGGIGSGWSIGYANGLGTNTRIGTDSNYISQVPFIGAVYRIKAGGAFQFDTGAVIPGDWSHVIVRTYHEINYRGLTGVENNISWLYEADYGENRNGWNYYGNYILGYKMPLIVNFAGLMLETKKILYTIAGNKWGDDYLDCYLGPLANVQFNDRISMTILSQWRTVRNYSSGTRNKGFYQDKELDSENPINLNFYRMAFNLTINI